MASEVERLIITLEASTKKYENALNKAQKQTTASLNAMERSMKRFNTTASTLGAGVGKQFVQGITAGGGKLSAALGGLLAIDKVMEYSDAWTNVGNRLQSLGVDSDKVASTQQDILDIAKRSRSEFEDVGTLYTRLLLSSNELGASQEEVARLTETVAKALKLGGANAKETSSAITQLAQGLASGKLQGDELKSVLENAPFLAKKLAQNLGTSIGQIRDLAAEGKLTSRDVFQALLKSYDEVDTKFKDTATTWEDAWTNLKNKAVEYTAAVQKAWAISPDRQVALRKVESKVEDVKAPAPSPKVDEITAKIEKLKSIAADADKTIQQLMKSNEGWVNNYIASLQKSIPASEEFNLTLDNIVEGFAGNEDAAVQAIASLDNLKKEYPRLGQQIQYIINLLKEVTVQFTRQKEAMDAIANTEMNVKIATEGPPRFMTGAADAKDYSAYVKMQEEYAAKKLEITKLSKEQLDIETRIDQIQKDAAKDNKAISYEYAKRIALAEIAQKKNFEYADQLKNASTSNIKFPIVQADMSTEIQEMQALAKAQDMTTLSGNALEAQEKLLQAAILSGVPITDAMRAKIEAMATAYGTAKDKVDEFSKRQQEIAQLQQTISSSFESAFMSIVDGSKSASDAFKDMAKQILAAIIKMQLQSMMSGLFGGSSSGGGFFSNIFGSLFTRASGGSVNSGQPYMVGEKGKELFVPNRNGRIVPNNALSGGSSGSNIKVMNFAGANVETRQRRGSGGKPEIEILLTEVGRRLGKGEYDKQMGSRFNLKPSMTMR